MILYRTGIPWEWSWADLSAENCLGKTNYDTQEVQIDHSLRDQAKIDLLIAEPCGCGECR